MSNSIFRQKSIDRINSPENLNDYVKVTNPSVWIVLIAVVILIMGAVVFGSVCEIESNVSAVAEITGGKAVIYVDEADVDKVQPGMSVRIDGEEYTISAIAEKALGAADIDEFTLHKGGMEASQWLYPAEASVALKDGIYVVTIPVEEISPMAYVFN